METLLNFMTSIYPPHFSLISSAMSIQSSYDTHTHTHIHTHIYTLQTHMCMLFLDIQGRSCIIKILWQCVEISFQSIC
jgi:hypothetical protein